MALVIEAIFENGTFRPLEPVDLAEGRKVKLSIDEGERRLSTEEMLALAQRVYEGLSEEDINEIEAIALDRSSFSRKREDD